MADILSLVNVQFEDSTVNINVDNTDILGCLIDYHWGPANQLLVLDRQTFFEYYPESVPVGADKVDATKYVGYAQIKKAFDLGMSRVEVLRYCKSGKWKYCQCNISSGGAVTVTQDQNNQFNAASAVSIALKYPGYVPQSMLGSYENIGIELAYIASTSMLTIKVCGVYTDANLNVVYAPIETYEGSLNPMAVLDGQNIFIENLVKTSQFISVKVNDNVTAPVSNISTTQNQFTKFNPTTTQEYLDPLNSGDNAAIKTAISHFYDDFDLSSCTLLISPYCVDNDDKNNIYNFDVDIINIAARRKNLNAIVGYPTSRSFDAASIGTSVSGYLASLPRDKFSDYVVGREYVYLFGQRLVLNCTGGWCGRTAAIARDVRLNQLASARTYGAYPGSLVESLNFGDVLTLHEQGVISIYKTKTGPQIFGVRSIYERQSSYFGKANVMRVTAALLRNIFPIVLDAIHTDIAANPISMNTMQVTLQSVVDEFIAAQNLRPQSLAICDSRVNTDYTTQHGTIFNIVLECWFIGLTEKVNIKVVATDSTVTAEFE